MQEYARSEFLMIEKTFDFEEATAIDLNGETAYKIGAIPAGATIIDISVTTKTPFNVNFKIGVEGETDKFMQNESGASKGTITSAVDFDAEKREIIYLVTDAAATTGKCKCLIQFFTPTLTRYEC